MEHKKTFAPEMRLICYTFFYSSNHRYQRMRSTRTASPQHRSRLAEIGELPIGSQSSDEFVILDEIAELRIQSDGMTQAPYLIQTATEPRRSKRRMRRRLTGLCGPPVWKNIRPATLEELNPTIRSNVGGDMEQACILASPKVWRVERGSTG